MLRLCGSWSEKHALQLFHRTCKSDTENVSILANLKTFFTNWKSIYKKTSFTECARKRNTFVVKAQACIPLSQKCKGFPPSKFV